MTDYKGNYTKYMNSGISLFDNKVLAFGTGDWDTAGDGGKPDFELKFDGTRLSVIPSAADAVFRFGDMDATTTDVQFSGTATANFMEWDASANALEFNGAGGIVMGASTTLDASAATVKGADIIMPFVFSGSDGGDVLATSGVLQAMFTVPFAMTITEVCAVCHGAITIDGSSPIAIDVIEGSTSILTTGMELVSTSETCVVTAPAAGAIYDNAVITIEVTAGTGSSVCDDTNDNASITVTLTGERA